MSAGHFAQKGLEVPVGVQGGDRLLAMGIRRLCLLHEDIVEDPCYVDMNWQSMQTLDNVDTLRDKALP